MTANANTTADLRANLDRSPKPASAGASTPRLTSPDDEVTTSGAGQVQGVRAPEGVGSKAERLFLLQH